MGRMLLSLKEVVSMVSDSATVISFTCLLLLKVVLPLVAKVPTDTFYSQRLINRSASPWPSQMCILWLECPCRAGRTEELTDEQQRPYMGHLLLALKEVTLVLSDLATIISFTCLVLLNVVFPLLSDWLGHTYFLGLVSRQSFFLISFRLRSIMGVAPW